MKKIVLLIILVVALIFAGKYVYDKQTENPVSLGGTNDAAQVSGSKDMELTKIVVNGSNALAYDAELRVTNYSKRALTINFFGMPKLFKMDQTGNYPTPVATSGVRVNGYISDPATTTRYSLNGPIYVRPGETKSFVVNAVFTDMATGTYKAALGAKSVSGYTVNGGSLLLLPEMKSRSVDFIPLKVTDVIFQRMSATLTKIINNQTPIGINSKFSLTATPIKTDINATNIKAKISLINVTTGAVVASSTAIGIPESGRVYFMEGANYPVDFVQNYSSSTVRTGNLYKAVINSITWTDYINGTQKTQMMDPNMYTTNVLTY